MLQLYSFALLFHVYIGWRLLPDMQVGMPWIVVMILWLVVSVVLIPFGFFRGG